MQPPFDHAAGVISTLVGYAGGTQENPTYRQVSAGETSHRESIEVTYDPDLVQHSLSGEAGAVGATHFGDR